MAVSTGCPELDRLLGGGIPNRRTALVTGGPGTGKSTFALQFLQAGLEKNESCLYVSTEQTREELVDSFEEFEFNLRHDNLDILALQAVPGEQVVHDDSMLVLHSDTDDPDERPLDFSSEDTLSYLRSELKPYAPTDRVVLDSVSALAAFATDPHRFRRDVLELGRFIANHFDATSLFTSERGVRPTADPTGNVDVDALKYITHAVIDLRRENIRGENHRRLVVEKLRGQNHDSRPHEYDITTSGLRVLSRRPIRNIGSETAVSTGIAGLDELLGGGVVRGGTALLEHDGRANLNEFVARVMEAALEQGFVVPFIPSVNMTPEQVDYYLSDTTPNVSELLEQDKLFIFDAAGVRDASVRNVFHVEGGAEDVQEAAELIAERRDDESLYYIANTEALLRAVNASELRDLRYWARTDYLTEQDTALFMHYPEMIDDELAEFFVDDANQVVETWLDDSGLQYLELEKSPTGYLGSSRYVEFDSAYPYIRVQSPSESGLR